MSGWRACVGICAEAGEDKGGDGDKGGRSESETGIPLFDVDIDISGLEQTLTLDPCEDVERAEMHDGIKGIGVRCSVKVSKAIQGFSG